MYHVEVRSANFNSFTYITLDKDAYQALLGAIGSIRIDIEKRDKDNKNISFEVNIKAA